MEVTLKGDAQCPNEPIRLNVEGLESLNLTHGGNYESIKLDISGSSLFCELSITKPKVEALTDLLGKLLQFRESDLAKLTLIDKEFEITNVIDDVINKIKHELIAY